MFNSIINSIKNFNNEQSDKTENNEITIEARLEESDNKENVMSKLNPLQLALNSINEAEILVPLNEKEKDLLSKKCYLQVIQLVSQRTGLSQAEAKASVDKVFNDMIDNKWSTILDTISNP